MKTRGFGSKPQPQIKYQIYVAELKRRYLTDNSEMLLGTVKIKVPKTLSDLTGMTATKRQVWDAFAKAACYCLLFSKPAEEKGVNQIFLFDNRFDLLERLETNTWEENGTTPTYQEAMSDRVAGIAWQAFQRCEVEVNWLDVPVVA